MRPGSVGAGCVAPLGPPRDRHQRGLQPNSADV